MPTDLAQFAQHDCLVVRENGQRFDVWNLNKAREKSFNRIRVQGPLSSNSGEPVRDWCLGGHGTMLRSLWDVAPQLQSGQLVRVLPQYARCTMLMCTGWHRTGRRCQNASDCWLIFWWSALETNPGKSHRPLRRPHDQAHPNSGNQRSRNGEGRNRL